MNVKEKIEAFLGEAKWRTEERKGDFEYSMKTKQREDIKTDEWSVIVGKDGKDFVVDIQSPTSKMDLNKKFKTMEDAKKFGAAEMKKIEKFEKNLKESITEASNYDKEIGRLSSNFESLISNSASKTNNNFVGNFDFYDIFEKMTDKERNSIKQDVEKFNKEMDKQDKNIEDFSKRITPFIRNIIKKK